MKGLDRKSRVLIKALRHSPDDLNLKLDSKGWARISDVLTSLEISKDELDIIVEVNDKKRFEYNEDETKIRASQGHSLKNLEVFKDWNEYIPIMNLYHGTESGSVSSILKGGLISKSRTHVHLSKDIQTAIKVGSRHGKPVVLIIDAVKMNKDGYRFYESSNGVILVDSVPSKYIKLK